MAEPTTTDPIALPQSNNDNKNKLVVFEDNNNNNNDPDMVATKKTMKKKKRVNIFKVALMLILRRPVKPNNVAAVDVAASKGMWKSLFASMRPLHLPSNESLEREGVDSPSLHPADEHVDAGLRASPSVENFEDVSSFPLSPDYIPKSASISSMDEMSRYASAVNLHELDQNDKDENENENENENKNKNDENNNTTEANMDGGDEMIDAKAEMFIAQFYEQIKLQRSDSDIHYMEMITRSIG